MSQRFLRPKPSSALMWILGYLNRWFLLLGVPVLRRIPWVRDLPGIRGRFRLRAIDFPEPDRERLRRAVNPSTAAFIAPNHPEFGFDWMMDKEISTGVAPRMASWASHDVIAAAPRFWLRQNLVTNAGGPDAQKYSVDVALNGDGVLLHPEGSVHWTGSHIHPLFNGVAEMACTAAARAGTSGRKVYIAPIVWSVEYAGDISAALHDEMHLIETSLGLPASHCPNVGARFRYLQENILARQMRAFGFDPAWVGGLDYFARQDGFRDWLIEGLDSRYEVEACDSPERLLARLRRAIPRENHGDRARVTEAERLCGYSRAVYSGPTLTQEMIAESLKRHRATLLRRGLLNAIHNFLPKPYGPRLVHVRVPEPMLIDPVRARDDRAAYVPELITALRAHMQSELDGLREAKSLQPCGSGNDSGMLNNGGTRYLERQHRLRLDQRSDQAVLGG
jgi:hypothetical protein